jgi:hypothetical protein
MPGIHPASQQQVRWAFAAEARGQLRASPGTTWTAREAKASGSLAREWAHRWKCWSWDKKTLGKAPPQCKEALELLDNIRRQNPTWKVPKGVTRAAPPPVVRPLRPAVPRPPPNLKIAAGRRKPKSRRTGAEVITAEALIQAALRRFG